MKLLAVTFIFIFSLTLATLSQTKVDDGLIEFTATFKDQTGAVLMVEPVTYFDGREKRVSRTDENGKLSTRLAPGLYELTFASGLANNFRAVIMLSTDAINPRNVEFTIEACDICCGDCPQKSWPKPVFLAEPSYPTAAMAVRATGSVIIAANVGADGKVIEASGISGHPLLRAASVQAARFSTFEPSAEAHKIILVYYFLDGEVDEKIKRRVNPYLVLVGFHVPTLDITEN